MHKTSGLHTPPNSIDPYIGLCGRRHTIEARWTLDEVQSENMPTAIDHAQRLRMDIPLNGVDGKEVGVLITGWRGRR